MSRQTLEDGNTTPQERLSFRARDPTQFSFLAANHRLAGERIKICFAGCSVGKTSLILRWVQGGFLEKPLPTKEDFYSKEFPTSNSGNNYIIELLDTSGDLESERHEKWFSWGAGFVLVYSVTDRSSFDLVGSYLEIIKTIKKNEKIPTVLVGTQADLEDARVVSGWEGLEKAELFDCPFLEVSAKTGLRIDEMFQTIKELILGETIKRRSSGKQNYRLSRLKTRPKSKSSSWIKVSAKPREQKDEFDTLKKEIGISFPEPKTLRQVVTKVPNLSNAVKEGWLYKEGGIRKSMKKRWFVLKGSNIYYFKHKEHKTPLGQITLPYASISIDEQRSFCFNLNTPPRSWVFIAEDQDSFLDWIHHLESVIHQEVNFGVSLDFVILRAKKRGYDSPVPIIVQKCIQFLRAKDCVNQEGIFRISGENAAVLELKNIWDEEEDMFFEFDMLQDDIHTISSMLKLYFRELQVPLLTFDLYDEWIATQHITEEKKRIQSVRQLVSALPENHRSTLQFLIAFLREIAANSSNNKMTSSNLSVVFGPTLCRSKRRYEVSVWLC